MKRRDIPDNVLDLLVPFFPLLSSQGSEIQEEANTNKDYHLGQKEYEFVQTLSGHVPVEKVMG